MMEVCSIRFPHSDISGSMDICSSPKLFAAYHVFHRLLVPRHPPCALISLTFWFIALNHWQLFTRGIFRYVSLLIVLDMIRFCFPHISACLANTHIISPRMSWYFHIIESSICSFQGTWCTGPMCWHLTLLSLCLIHRLLCKWRWRDSNSWPPACKAGALPTELHPHGCGPSLY